MKDKFKKISLYIILNLIVFMIGNSIYNYIISSVLEIIFRFTSLNIINIYNFSDIVSIILAIISCIITTLVFYKVIIKNIKKETITKMENISVFSLLFLMFLFSDLFYIIPFELLNIDYNSLSYNIKTLSSLISSLILGFIIILIYKDYLKEKLIDYKKHFNEYMEIGMKWWFLGLIGMSVTNILIGTFSPVQEANNEVLVQEMLKQAPFLSFLSAAFVAPFLEEMLFRKSVGDIFKNKKLMVIASGVIFGLLHVIFSLQTPWDLLYIVPYGLLGSSFAYMLYKSDNVFIPITFHVLHNGLLTLISILL